ncbi:MAG: hypothetical protein FWC41_00530 [Firmicutes bacterium]|nr:hypothetical protein [Bacillota bacterium]
MKIPKIPRKILGMILLFAGIVFISSYYHHSIPVILASIAIYVIHLTLMLTDITTVLKNKISLLRDKIDSLATEKQLDKPIEIKLEKIDNNEWIALLEKCNFTDEELKIIKMRRRGWTHLNIAVELKYHERSISRKIKKIEQKIESHYHNA